MDELIGRHWKRSTTPDEERTLRAWRAASEHNEQYYSELIRLFEVAAVSERREDRVAEPSAADVIRMAERNLDRAAARSRPFWRRGWFLPAAAAAAMVAVFVGVGDRLREPSTPAVRLGAGEFVTGPAEKATLTLGDGTVVRLAPGSRLRVRDTDGERRVQLDGRAYFAVARMEGVPFHVETHAGVATALGTRFEVRLEERNDDLRLVVVEGRVALSAAGHRVEVVGGHMSTIAAGTISPPIKVDAAPLVDWVGRFMAFQATPLAQAAREIEREYGTRVEVTDSALARLTVTGWYVDREFEEVVAIVCGVVNARCSIDGDTAMIAPDDASPR